MENIYNILGVDEGCSSTELKSAFMSWKKRQQEILKTGKPEEQALAAKRITDVTILYKAETKRLLSMGETVSTTPVEVKKSGSPKQETVVKQYKTPEPEPVALTPDDNAVSGKEKMDADEGIKPICKPKEEIKQEPKESEVKKLDVQTDEAISVDKKPMSVPDGQPTGNKNIGIVIAVVVLIGVSCLGVFLLKGNSSNLENQMAKSSTGTVATPKELVPDDNKRDVDKYNKKLEEYRRRLQVFNKSLLNKKEVVFLSEKVESPKSINDLCVIGKFYNGTQDNVTGVKEILVDVRLRNFDDEVVTLKNVSVNNPLFHSMPMSPGEYSDTVTIVLPNIKVEKEYNNFEVRVHGIHWTRRVLVKR